LSGQLYDRTDPEWWRNIRPQTTLTLTDEQALRENINGQNYLVQDGIVNIKQLEGLCEWLLFPIEGLDGAPDCWLMAKIVGDNVTLRVYFESDDFQSGNREDMFEQQTIWMFCEPDDVDDFEYGELEFAKHIGWDFPGDEEGDDNIHVDYNIKGAGEMQGKVRHFPSRSGDRDLIATVAEYDTSDETTCPEMLMLEIGHHDCDEGGLIQMMFGNEIRTLEVDVLAVTA